MSAGPPSRIHRVITVCCCFLLAGFLALWIHVVVRQFGVIHARGELVDTIGRGDVDSVVTLVDRIDHTWLGSAGEWTGESSLATQQGFSWLIEQWMSQVHTKGLLTLYQKRIEKDPAFPRSELIEPLEWLWSQKDRESLEAFFGFLLELEYVKGDKNSEITLAKILDLAGRDAGLALMAWEAHEEGRLAGELPDEVVKTAIRPANFAAEERNDRLMSLMGLTAPVETFVVRKAVPDPSWRSGTTWIERVHRILADEGNEEVERAKEHLRLAEATPERPGLFLLNLLLEDSAGSGTGDHREFSPARIDPALPVFDRLTPEGKAGVADVLDRNIPDYGEHDALRRWVGKHMRPAWEKQRDHYLTLPADGIDKTWDIEARQLKEWLRSAAKHGLANETTATVMSLYRLGSEKRSLKWRFDPSGAYTSHPFSLATIGALWTNEGTTPLPDQFSLVLAFARDPSLPPCESFPDLNEMAYGKSSGPRERSPWYRATAEEFNEAMTRLGEPFVDDPLRFLIVPFFHDYAENFSETLPQPEALAEFQRLAASNDRPGGWLAKDLADLLPRWWCRSKAKHDALLAAGGHSYSYERMNAYLADRTTPVGARMSYFLGLFDWHMAPNQRNRQSEVGASFPYFPATDELALEFAKEFEAGTWQVESIPVVVWNRVVRVFLNEPDIPDHSEQARNRKAAREALRSRLDPYVKEKFASPPPPSPGSRQTGLDEFADFLKIYASLLQIEEDDKALASLWDEAERTMLYPKAVFTYLPGYRGDRSQVLGSASADAIVRRYREKGWGAVREHVSGMDGPTAYSALSEATSQLTFPEWVDFCGRALDLRNDPTGPGSSGWERFCAFPPSPLLTQARNLKNDERIALFASEFADIVIPPEHAGFFALALPITIRNCVNRGDSGSNYLRSLAENENAPISPVILREFDIACNTADSVIEARHFDALQSKEVPLAQRWISSAFFQISRGDRTIYYPRIADWPVEFRHLSELGTDVLIDGVDQGLPLWHLMDHGLGNLAFDPRHGNLTVVYFSSLYRLDRTSQEARAARLTAPSRLVDLLRNHPNPKPLLEAFYRLALEMDNRILVTDLFTHAESALSFEEKLRWLSQGKFHAPMAHLFSRHWPRIGGLSLGFSNFAQGEELDAILSALPDDPDLRRLVRATLQHHSMSTGLVNPGSNKVFESHSTVVNAFLRDKFKSPEMEALCLARLPVRMEQSPQLGAWLDNRLKDRDWKKMLAQEPQSIRFEWPYWARQIEALAGAGDFETLGKMLPAPSWFASHPHLFAYDPYNETDTIEEMVWMGFARPVAHHLRFGTVESRVDAGAIAARLLSSPPSSKRRDLVSQPAATASHRATSFHADAAHELWLYAIAATLSATLDEPAEVALARCRKFELPTIPSVTHDPMVRGASHQMFFRLLAEYGETMTQEERTRFLLRGLDAEPLIRRPINRNLPCYSLSRIQLPSQISMDHMVDLARHRHESGGDSAYRAADLGLVLDLAKNPKEAFPLLENALAALSPTRPEDLEILELIRPVHSRIASKAGTKHPTVGQ